MAFCSVLNTTCIANYWVILGCYKWVVTIKSIYILVKKNKQTPIINVAFYKSGLEYWFQGMPVIISCYTVFVCLITI